MPKVSQEHLDARRDQILDAATACFARHGVRETTMRLICAEAGLSAGAVYRYFDSKSAILRAVHERSIAENRAFAEQIAASMDVGATLRQLARGMVEILRDPARRQEQQLSVRVHAEGLSDPEVAATYVALHHDIVDRVRPELEARQRAGGLPADLDVEYLLWVLMAAYQGLRVHSLLDPSLDLDRFAAALDRVVRRSVELGPSSAEEAGKIER